MILDPKIPAKIAQLEATYDRLRYTAVETLSMEIAETREHHRSLPDGLEWRRVEPGEAWGEDWTTAWFRGSVTVPSELDGQTVLLRAITGGPEAMLFVDGTIRGVFDPNHPVRVLDLKAQGGKTYAIALEAYAGHNFPGVHPAHTEGSADGVVYVRKEDRRYEAVQLVTERPDVSRFVFGLRALRQLAEVLDPNSLRRGRIVHAFEAIFRIVWARPEETDEATWRAALMEVMDVIQPLLEEKNGPTTPTMGIMGHSHIDTAWLWTIAETWRKIGRTYSSVLALMDQYPEFRFTQSAAYHYEKCRELYPEVFERVVERVKEGRWEVNGAMYIEPDCNIPSGESFARQCLVGQRSYREMFGKTTDALWQPDVFGYSAALPQILQKSGVRYFLTTKLSWNDTNRFPVDTFWWQGIDGSRVLAHFNEMQGELDPAKLTRLWNDVIHKDVQDRRLVGFGWGDGGGGPMAEMIEMARLCEDLEGCPKTEYSSISEFMQGMERDLDALPLWVGELYLELHRGTLTSIADIKRLNRRCEFELRDAELVWTLAALKGHAYPRADFLEAWKVLLVNQFHDILPGSSIAAVNDQAKQELNDLEDRVSEIEGEAHALLAGDVDDAGVLSALNSLSWERTGEMAFVKAEGFALPAGDVVQAFEDVDGVAHVAVTGLTLAPMGTTPLPTGDGAPTNDGLGGGDSPFVVTNDAIETPFARVRLDDGGRIVSFFDKAAERELVRAGGALNSLEIGEDVPAVWDNWDIDRDQRHKLRPLGTPTVRRVVADGPLQLRLELEYAFGVGSTLKQHVVFHSTTPRVDFDTVVDWHEKYQFLKSGFDLDVLADSARHEIQFGHVTRGTHDNTTWDRAQFDVCAHKWTDVSEGAYGVAFLNDSKYACTVKEGRYVLSLVKSGRHPDPRGDEGRHRFAYAMLPHAGGFSVESVVRPAYEFNVAPTLIQGREAVSLSLLSVDAPNVIVEAVKWAEDHEAFVVRLYEAGRTGAWATVRFGVPVASIEETNLLEEEGSPVTQNGGEARLYFRPFEIKTLLVEPA